MTSEATNQINLEVMITIDMLYGFLGGESMHLYLQIANYIKLFSENKEETFKSCFLKNLQCT